MKAPPLDPAAVPRSVVHLLADAARDHPTSPAVRFEDARVDYATYAGLVGAFARELASTVRPRDRVVLLMQNSLDLAVATFAAHALRAQVCALNPAYGPRELSHMLADADPVLVLVDDSVRADVASLLPAGSRAEVRRAGDGKQVMRLRDRLAPLPDDLPTHDDLATLQYTGGTTGRSKGVDIAHRQLATNVAQRDAWLPSRHGEEVMLCPMPLFHVSAVAMCLHLCVHAAGELVILRRYAVGAVLDALVAGDVTLMSAAPAIYHDLLAQPRLAEVSGKRLRACYSGAAPLPVQTLERFEAITGCPIFEGYGMSEAGPCMTYNPVDRKRQPGSVGLPVPGSDIEVVGPSGHVMPDGQIGEIRVRGPHVMHGYRNLPELTAEVLKDGWLSTGDLGMFDEFGYLTVRGRHHDVINVGGLKVYPVEIEQVLRERPEVSEAAAFAVDDERLGQIVHAWVAPARDMACDPEKLRAHCAAHLAPYKTPRAIGVVDSLPRTSVGKLARDRLRPVGEPASSQASPA